LASLRELYGFVPQEVFLFSDTIESNIAFGTSVEQAEDDAIAAAAKLAAFDEEVAGFPDGYETMLGERGINLSGGQKQRCAIARAILKNPAILILDDALSAVDTRTEDRILENLKEAVRGRTVIIVSHRVSAVRHADQILVLRDGVIEERGVHDELVRAGWLYADMVEQQRLKSEIEVI
ncbi:MAG: ATP-binding cassette domain-containing protein, partial [Deltaproteobacteria bacterium]|nr:ATP-binding cassette domain-containing protein [Deltaproteobacteria bacterium]